MSSKAPPPPPKDPLVRRQSQRLLADDIRQAEAELHRKMEESKKATEKLDEFSQKVRSVTPRPSIPETDEEMAAQEEVNRLFPKKDTP